MIIRASYRSGVELSEKNVEDELADVLKKETSKQSAVCNSFAVKGLAEKRECETSHPIRS